MAMIDRFFSTSILSSLFWNISCSNSLDIASAAASESDGLTAKVMEYSDDAWVMRIIFTSFFARAPNSLARYR